MPKNYLLYKGVNRDVQEPSRHEQYPSLEHQRPEVKIAYERVTEVEDGIANLEAHRQTPMDSQIPQDDQMELAA